MPYHTSLRGDPGLIGGLAIAARGVARAARAVVRRPAAGRSGASGTVVTRGPGGIIVPALPAATGVALAAGPATRKARQVTRDIREFAGRVVTGDECPKGYRLNRSGYWTKSEGWVEPRTKCVRIRSRNVANARALRRSLSRVQGFEKLVRRSRKSLRALAKI